MKKYLKVVILKLLDLHIWDTLNFILNVKLLNSIVKCICNAIAYIKFLGSIWNVFVPFIPNTKEGVTRLFLVLRELELLANYSLVLHLLKPLWTYSMRGLLSRKNSLFLRAFQKVLCVIFARGSTTETHNASKKKIWIQNWNFSKILVIPGLCMRGLKFFVFPVPKPLSKDRTFFVPANFPSPR
jgi:uncharacterized membrane protein